ncbi:MAG: hypothetical protein KBA81_07035 [Rhabdochlamydiaceae bacterium]|nr:hypothetical protein [Rhabdochlamydiaceae bacterium]
MSINVSPQTQVILSPDPTRAKVDINQHKNQANPNEIPTASFDPQIIEFFGGREAVDKLPRLILSNYRNRGEPDFKVKKEAIERLNSRSASPAIAIGSDSWFCPFIRINFAERYTPKAPILFMVIYGVNEDGKIKWYLQDEEFSTSHPDYELLKNIVSHTDAVYKLVAARHRNKA